MAAATSQCLTSSITSLSFPTIKPNNSINSLIGPNSFKPICFSNRTTPTLTGLRISKVNGLLRDHQYRVLAVSELKPESELSDSNKDTTIDIKLPRRSLLVQFTCNECGERTQRFINRLAYERGLVFVQCAGCRRHHKLVDNLGLVVEYDLREEINSEANTDQV
ncbi:mitochondrial protein import protein ZIM17 [Mangifera indica]|uniref:mitochondrial protein import protein ZIM17 n=1 Tax=Mangifera indica TaxID=29780 RepID=UPI001CFB120B|nr:mitochondrial protein import protein ZIM17 [Mangifera indica]